MDTGDSPGSTESASKSSSAAKPTKSVNMVPGGNPGGGARQETPVAVANSAQPSSGSSDSGSSGSSGGGSSDTGSGSGSSGFSQFGPGADTGNSGSALEPGFGNLGGSAIAIVFAMFGLLVL
jgi:hypothetical protein